MLYIYYINLAQHRSAIILTYFRKSIIDLKLLLKGFFKETFLKLQYGGTKRSLKNINENELSPPIVENIIFISPVA